MQAGERWIVNVLSGGRDERQVFLPEISVVKEGNAHGIRSYGWGGEDKIIVFSDGGPCRHNLPIWLFKQHLATADLLSAHLNHAERHGLDKSQYTLPTQEEVDASLTDKPERPHYCPPDDYQPADLGPYEG